MRIFLLSLILVSFFTSLNAADLDIDLSPIKKDDVGLSVYSIDDKKEVVSINADKKFAFASNVKLFTAAAALKNLGGSFVFTTDFSFDPAEGILYIKSMGNPTVVIEDMWVIANELSRKGVKGIKKIVADDFAYGEAGYKAAKGSENGSRAYLAFISPISFNYNSVEVTVSPAKEGEPANFTTDNPAHGHFIVKNESLTAKGSANTINIDTRPKEDKTEILITGRIGESVKAPRKIFRKIFNPAGYFADTLMFLMGEKPGIPVERKKLSDKFVSGYKFESRDLHYIITTMNRFSSNFVAESILCYMGAYLKGNAEEGLAIIKNYAKANLGEEPDIINGSGIGNGFNFVTPELFIKLLKHVYADKFFSIDFFSTLPVAGEEGTMKKIKTDFNGSVRAKTGSLSGIASLCGIMKAKSGKLYLFAFVVNNHPGAYRDTVNYRDKVIEQVWNRL